MVRTNNGTAYGVNHEFEIPYYVEAGAEEPSVGITEATLHGHVNPAGVEAKYHFAYGTTEAYGSSTPEVSAGSGESDVMVSATLTNLTPGTFYHYRIVASSSRGTTTGADRTFLTKGGKPAADTLNATPLGYNSADLQGRVEAKGVSTTVYFEYGTTSAYGQRSVERSLDEVGSDEMSAIVGGLTPNTTYHFRVVASNSFGTSYGADQTFSTSPEPVVQTEAAAAVGYISATLGAAINPQGTELNYYFEYGTKTSYGERTKESGAGSGTSDTQETAIVNGLAEGTTYHFRVVAINPQVPNNKGVIYGASQTFSTGVQPAMQTSTPTGVGPAEATLNGTINPHATAVKYYFEYGLTTAYGSSTTQMSAGAGSDDVAASQRIAALSPNTTYHCRLVAVSDSIDTYGGDVAFTTAPSPLTEAINPTPFPTPVKTTGPQPSPNETPPPPAAQTPVVQNAHQSTTRWHESDRLARISRAKTPTGTTFSFSLNEQATISFTFTQLMGSYNNHSCLASPHETRQRKSCNRKVAKGALSFTGHAGTNSVVFAGRISRHEKLNPGAYELTITATNAVGQRSAPARLRFTITQA